MASEILIRGMVCERCISVIRKGITNLGYEVNKVSLGNSPWIQTSTRTILIGLNNS